jgi:hypothetical protein
MCRRKFGSRSVIFIFMCINPFISSYKCYCLCSLNSMAQTCVLGKIMAFGLRSNGFIGYVFGSTMHLSEMGTMSLVPK